MAARGAVLGAVGAPPLGRSREWEAAPPPDLSDGAVERLIAAVRLVAASE